MIQSYSLQFNITTRLERNKTGSLLNTVNVIYLKLFLLFNYTQLIYPFLMNLIWSIFMKWFCIFENGCFWAVSVNQKVTFIFRLLKNCAWHRFFPKWSQMCHECKISVALYLDNGPEVWYQASCVLGEHHHTKVKILRLGPKTKMFNYKNLYYSHRSFTWLLSLWKGSIP